MTAGSPACGSSRLKSAPLPVVGAIVGLVVGRRRYRCADCRWTGWKHRLRRRSDGASTSLHVRTTPDRRAIWFFIVSLLVVASVPLLRSCESGEPGPRDIPTSSVGTIERLAWDQARGSQCASRSMTCVPNRP